MTSLRRTSLLLTTAFVAAALALPARADIAPPPGYVEQCTAAIQQQEGEVCVECATYHAEPNRCVETLGGEHGHTKRCQTRGGSTWSEVWCRPRTEADTAAPAPVPAPVPAPAPAPAAEQPSEDAPAASSSCAVGRGGSAAWLALVGLGLALLARRRK